MLDYNWLYVNTASIFSGKLRGLHLSSSSFQVVREPFAPAEVGMKKFGSLINSMFYTPCNHVMSFECPCADATRVV